VARPKDGLETQPGRERIWEQGLSDAWQVSTIYAAGVFTKPVNDR
jgi:hypothetical protein